MREGMHHEIDVDALVAQYASFGKTRRRKRAGGRALGGTAAALLVSAVAAAVWQSGFDVRTFDPALPAWLRADSSKLDELRAQVQSELGALSAARADLAAERGRFEAQTRELETALAAFATRSTAIEAQQAALAAQAAQLQDAIAAVDAERAQLVAAQARGPALERELAAITAERRSLEQRRQEFAAEGAELSSELYELEAQRRMLETERADMERERRALEALLETAGRGAEPAAQPAADPAGALDPTLTPLTAALVDARALDSMRAGVIFDNGMNVAIGLTRTASVNGEEQYVSSLQLDDLAAGIGPAGLAGFGNLVIQNGTGNSVAPDVLDGAATGFGTIVQNTLDNQQISTSTIYDVTIRDVGTTVRGLAASQALADSLSFQR
jgi:hypothetical protein